MKSKKAVAFWTWMSIVMFLLLLFLFIMSKGYSNIPDKDFKLYRTTDASISAKEVRSFYIMSALSNIGQGEVMGIISKPSVDTQLYENDMPRCLVDSKPQRIVIYNPLVKDNNGLCLPEQSSSTFNKQMADKLKET